MKAKTKAKKAKPAKQRTYWAVELESGMSENGHDIETKGSGFHIRTEADARKSKREWNSVGVFARVVKVMVIS